MLDVRSGEVQAEVHKEWTDAFLGRHMAASRISKYCCSLPTLASSLSLSRNLLYISMLFTCRTSPCHLFSQLRMSLPGFEAATTARGRCAAGLRCFRTTSTYGSCLLQARLLKVWLNYRKHTWLTFSLPSDCIPRACTLGCAWSAKRYVCLFKRAKYSLAQNGLKLKECRMAAAQK